MRRKWGDVREDGMVFLRYQKSCKNGEHWVTRENFEKCKENQNEQKRKFYSKNPEKLKDRNRKFKIRKSFAKCDGSSYAAWIKSLTKPLKAFAALDALTPSPNQTLAELIHELSGYPMATCEAIANPPAPETETEIETTNEMKEDLF